MHRIVFVVIASVTSLGTTATADAAARHKVKHHTRPFAAQTAPSYGQAAWPNRPRWAAPQQCFTDDGYGRFTPCEGGGKGY
ncbi:MAG TPA: hypothetical protein VJT13_14315 [Xanthobacteraceae bacterium]|nr:hypothetical protein [Xanthobacteraceae bacterium]